MVTLLIRWIVYSLVALALPISAAPYLWSSGERLGGSDALSQWAQTLALHAEQRATIKNCTEDVVSNCPGKLKGLSRLITRAQDLPLEKQLQLVNYYVNTVRHRYDRPQFLVTAAHSSGEKVRSQWRTLLDFLQKGGDCEDYASSKYFLLRELGVAADNLRIVVVYDRRERSHHALLAVRRPDESVWLLDVDNNILKSPHRGYNRYIYAVNEESVWDHEVSTG